MLVSNEKDGSSSVVFIAVRVRTEHDSAVVVFKSQITNLNMKYVKLDQLKLWARGRFPRNNAVRVAVESQPDQLSIEEFVVLLKMLDLMMATR